MRTPRGLHADDPQPDARSSHVPGRLRWPLGHRRHDRLPRPRSVTDPRCLGVESWSSIYGGSPTCLDYPLDAQFDAAHCELYLEGLGDGYEGHYGIPYRWLVGYLRVGPQDGEVLGAGMFTRYLDPRDGATHDRFSLGVPAGDGVWKTGFTYLATGVMGDPAGTYAFTVERFAFFVDVRRPDGRVVRLWQSRGGADYAWSDAFSLPTATQSIPYGCIEWAADGAAVYDQRWACQ